MNNQDKGLIECHQLRVSNDGSVIYRSLSFVYYLWSFFRATAKVVALNLTNFRDATYLTTVALGLRTLAIETDTMQSLYHVTIALVVPTLVRGTNRMATNRKGRADLRSPPPGEFLDLKPYYHTTTSSHPFLCILQVVRR